MIPTLKQVLEQAEQLAPEQQQALAAQFQQVLDDFLADQHWEELFSDPRGITALERLAQEAIEADERGETEEGGFGD